MIQCLLDTSRTTLEEQNLELAVIIRFIIREKLTILCLGRVSATKLVKINTILAEKVPLFSAERHVIAMASFDGPGRSFDGPLGNDPPEANGPCKNRIS